jgi:hypothetical protein
VTAYQKIVASQKTVHGNKYISINTINPYPIKVQAYENKM